MAGNHNYDPIYFSHAVPFQQRRKKKILFLIGPYPDEKSNLKDDRDKFSQSIADLDAQSDRTFTDRLSPNSQSHGVAESMPTELPVRKPLFLPVKESKEEVAEYIYSRNLIQVVLNNSKNLDTVKSPLEETRLRNFGMNRSTVRTADKLRPVEVKTNFYRFPYRSPQNYWSATTEKSEHIMRTSKSKRTDEQIAKKLARISEIEAKILERQKKFLANAAKMKELKRKFVYFLLTIPYVGYSCDKIERTIHKQRSYPSNIADAIFSLVMQLPDHNYLYANLFKEWYLAEQEQKEIDSQWSLCDNIVKRTKDFFEQTVYSQRGRTREVKELPKQNLINIINFISHLYRVGLLDDKILNEYIFCLLQNITYNQNVCNELMVEYAVTLIKGVGRYAKKNDSIEIDSYVGFLDRYKSKVSDQVRFMIVDLEEMMKNKWQKETGLKTEEELRQKSSRRLSI